MALRFPGRLSLKPLTYNAALIFCIGGYISNSLQGRLPPLGGEKIVQIFNKCEKLC